MAAGAITYDTGSPIMGGAGTQNTLTGTIEVDDTYRTFALLSTASFVVSFAATDSSGAGSIEVDYNVNSSGTATNGSIAVVGNHKTTNTYNYICVFI